MNVIELSAILGENYILTVNPCRSTRPHRELHPLDSAKRTCHDPPGKQTLNSGILADCALAQGVIRLHTAHMQLRVNKRPVAQRLDEPRKLNYRHATNTVKGGLVDLECLTLPWRALGRYKQNTLI